MVAIRKGIDLVLGTCEPSRFGQHRQHWLGRLAGGFYALNFRISYKMYSECPKHVLPSYKRLVDGLCNFI